MWSRGRSRLVGDGETGSAIVLVLAGILLLSAMGLATLLLAAADTLASANQRDARAVLYGAEAGLELAAAELAAEPDWNAVLSGAARSAFADGPPSGGRAVPGGATIGLDEMANAATCGLATGCSTAARSAVTDERPWGPNNPRWRPYRYGLLSAGGSASDIYVVVLVGDDPAEIDGDPERDGVAPGSPGAGVVMLRSEAFGSSLSRRSVEAVLVRVAVPGGAMAPRFLSWREVR